MPKSNPSRRHLLVIALAAAATPSLAHQVPKMRPQLNGQMPLIFAHRGACGYAPEHTALSYETAINMGADYIEPDLCASKDGHLVVRHDPILADSTDVEAHPEFADRKRTLKMGTFEITDFFISDFTLAELKTLRCKQVMPQRDHSHDGQYQILTFDEVIDIAKEGSRRAGRTIGICPELKSPTYHQSIGLNLEDRILERLERANLNHANAKVIIQSFEQANLKALRPRTPLKLMQLLGGSRVDPTTGDMIYEAPDDRPFDWTLSGRTGTYGDLLTPQGLDEVAAYADIIAPYKPMLISYRTDPVTGTQTPIIRDHIVKMAHERGLLVGIYTMRNEAKYLEPYYRGDPLLEYNAFFDIGVDALFSDFPDTAVMARDQFIAPPPHN